MRKLTILVGVLGAVLTACGPGTPPAATKAADHERASAEPAPATPDAGVATRDDRTDAGAAPRGGDDPARAAAGTQVATGEKHACVLKADGAVFCWGDNSYGQLGDASDLEMHARPVRVRDLPPATAIAAGGTTSCAITKDARLFCWGDAITGQLVKKPDCKADGAEPRSKYAQCSPHPIEMPLKDVTHVFVGRHHVCSATRGGDVTCWGGNEYGQMGTGANDSTRHYPPTKVKLAGSGDVVQLYGDIHDQCARQKDGTVTCWGPNGFAQTCRTKSPLAPTAIDAFRGADEIGGMGRLLCGRKGATVTCCGGQSWKQRIEKRGRETITHDDETTLYKTPTIVPDLAGAERLAATDVALCGRVKGAWRCIADVVMVDDPSRNKNAVIPAPPDDLARVTTFSQRVFLRDDGVVLVPSGSTVLGPKPITPLAW